MYNFYIIKILLIRKIIYMYCISLKKFLFECILIFNIVMEIFFRFKKMGFFGIYVEF